MNVKVKKLYPEAKLPTYATDGSACFDIYSHTNGEVDWQSPCVFRTGLSFEIPEGFVMMVYSRSGHGFKEDVRLCNTVAVIDSDFRGELLIKLACDRENWGMSVNAGDRIAQGMVIPVEQVQFEEADSLSDTERGEGGFGSSGR